MFKIYTIFEEDISKRLDRFLAEKLEEEGFSRSQLKTLIMQGAISIGQASSDSLLEEKAEICLVPKKLLRDGEVVLARLEQQPRANHIEPWNFKLDIVFEDEHILVLNKPSGLIVHPASSHRENTLVHALAAHNLEAFREGIRPGIVHRLDKDTSGLMVVAKTQRAFLSLSHQISRQKGVSFQRSYQAFVWGSPSPQHGSIHAPIGRSRTQRTHMAIVPLSHGRPAHTDYRTTQIWETQDSQRISQILCTLQTGRTHQIRVHMASALKTPLIGDPLYASGVANKRNRLPAPVQGTLDSLKGQALHACELSLKHPITQMNMSWHADLPKDLQKLLKTLSDELCDVSSKPLTLQKN